MPLRARKPEPVQKRLKLFTFGPAGVGKTTAAIQFPKAYIIDCERGTENYEKLITANGSSVYQTVDVHEVIAEVRALLTERHEYRTLVIDPITPIYNDLLEKCEAKVGADFGRHYGAANKEMKRLANLIMALDMNVVITAHAKTEYGENLRKLGYTFDGWRQLDYWFDLVIELTKKGKKRMGKVVKTRIETFPDEDLFEWSYDAFRQRYDLTMLERDAQSRELATPQQVAEILQLLNIVRLPDGLVDTWFEKARVDDWEDMPSDVMAKCIEYVKSRFPTNRSAAPERATIPSDPMHNSEDDSSESETDEEPKPQQQQARREQKPDPKNLPRDISKDYVFLEEWDKLIAPKTDQARGREFLQTIINKHARERNVTADLRSFDREWRQGLLDELAKGTFDANLAMKKGTDVKQPDADLAYQQTPEGWAAFKALVIAEAKKEPVIPQQQWVNAIERALKSGGFTENPELTSAPWRRQIMKAVTERQGYYAVAPANQAA